MRILFILPKTTQGGAETQLLYLLKGINKKKFDVTLGLLYADEHLKQEFRSLKGVKIVEFKKRGKLDLGIYARIARFVRDNNIDIVQTFLGNHHAYLPCVLAGKAIPIGGVRNTYGKVGLAERLKEFTVPRMLASKGRFFLVSNSFSAARSFKGFPTSSIMVIPNGIMHQRFTKANGQKIRKELRLGKSLVMGMISRMATGKNQEMLVRNFKKIAGNLNCRLVLAGDGPELDRCRQLAKDLGVADRIIFTGNRRDVPDLLAAFDIYVFPSKYLEAWPNAIGEAMAAGLPVVAYSMGDVRQIIEDGKDGYVVDCDEERFCERARKLLSDKRLRKAFGSRARAKIRREFPVSRMVREYENLYSRVVSR